MFIPSGLFTPCLTAVVPSPVTELLTVCHSLFCAPPGCWWVKPKVQLSQQKSERLTQLLPRLPSYTRSLTG